MHTGTHACGYTHTSFEMGNRQAHTSLGTASGSKKNLRVQSSLGSTLSQLSFPLPQFKNFFHSWGSLYSKCMRLRLKLELWQFKILQLLLPHYVQDILVHSVNSSPVVKLRNSLKNKNKNHTGEHPLSFLRKLGTKQGVQRRALSTFFPPSQPKSPPEVAGAAETELGPSWASFPHSATTLLKRGIQC